jgi:alkylation response protein AidB-like acyl-CoA dehydrogenase
VSLSLSAVLGDEQRLLRESVQRWTAEGYGFAERSRRLSATGNDGLWRFFGEQGWLGVAVPTDYGGAGLGPLETALLMHEFGKVLLAEPYLGCAVLGAGIVLAAGRDQQKARLLPALCEGTSRIAFAYAEPRSRYDLADVATVAAKADGGWRINGHKAVVLGAPLSDQLVVSARTSGERRDRSGISLFCVPAAAQGLERRDYRTVDGLAAADIALRDVVVDADALLGPAGSAFEAIEAVVDTAAGAVVAEAVGAMEFAVFATRDHLKQRQQFGRALAEFQVLQHRTVDMYIALEESRSMSLWAASALAGADAPERRIAVSAAKAHVAEAGRVVGHGAVQLHGGMGIIDEFPIGHYLKRLTAIDRLFGDRMFHLDRYSSERQRA